MRRTQATAILLKVVALWLSVSLYGWGQTQSSNPPTGNAKSAPTSSTKPADKTAAKATAKSASSSASQPKAGAQTNSSAQASSKPGVASAAKPAAPAASKAGNAQTPKPVSKATAVTAAKQPAGAAPASKTAAAQAAKPAGKAATTAATKPAGKPVAKAATAAQAKQPTKPAIAAKAAPAAKKPAAAAPGAEASKEEEGEGPEKIEMANKRDPFVPLINQQKPGPTNLPPGKAGLVIGTVRVDGTVRGQQGEMIAVVSNPDQRVYFIRQGDRLYDGDVEKIDMEGVTFRVSTKDAFGKPIERVVTKKVYAMAGEQQ